MDIQTHTLNVDKIREVVDDIRTAIVNENNELEAEISVLHDNMDQEVDDISSKASTPRSDVSRLMPPTTIPAPYCTKCAMSHKQSKIRAIKALPSKSLQCTCQSSAPIPEPPNPPRAGTGKGKFRSRLQEARDEHHFMEDVDMI